jgi:ADP-heptose:LPS heptosyltransferase
LAAIPNPDGNETAWLNLMPGMLRVAGNRILSERSGLSASAYPDNNTRCEFSPGRNVIEMRELLEIVFNGVAPELPFDAPRSAADDSVWFSPFPGADERLWPPEAWAQALAPLAGKRIILQPSSKPIHRRWHADFLKHCTTHHLTIETACTSDTIFDLIQMMHNAKAWVGINSAPMHVAALLGLPSLALGLPWEANARWNHPTLQIIAAEKITRELQQSPSPERLRAFIQTVQRSDDWADGIYLDPEEFASALRAHPLFKSL